MKETRSGEGKGIPQEERETGLLKGNNGEHQRKGGMRGSRYKKCKSSAQETTPANLEADETAALPRRVWPKAREDET